ncbi:MAG: tetratricopeptide repeat protein [Acidobacteriota bacterium]|jgi:tetratricopeptide (TPR) repeat protein
MKIPFLLFLLALPLTSTPDKTLDQAMKHYEKGEYKEASELLSTIGDSSNNAAEAKFWLGKSYLKMREWGDAVKAMKKAVDIEPSNALYRLWLGRAYGENADHRKNPFGAWGDARECRKQFEKARELDPENINIRFDLVEFYAQAPGVVGGDKDKARKEAEVISKLEPKLGYAARAAILEQEKEWDLAKKEFLQATLDFPNDADTHKDLAQFLFDREDYDGALAGAQKALKLDSLSKRTRVIIAASQVQLAIKLDEAEKNLTNLVSSPWRDGDPSFEELYYWLGVCYFKNGEKEKAKNAFQSALAHNPEYKKAKQYLDKLK